MEDDGYYLDADLDLSFSSSSATTDRTFASSSARSSLARSSLTLSFNDRLSSTATTPSTTTTSSSSSAAKTLHQRRYDPHWESIKAATTLSSDGKLHLRHLKLVRHLGTGNLGRVFLCNLRDFPNSAAGFALKVIDRDSLTAKKLSHVRTEAEILSMLDHPYLPTLYAKIEASHYTCLLIDYCPNGDLHYLLRKQPDNRLTIKPVRFFAAEVLVALEYLHALGIVYRDLKPENILIREDGHVMLSDFDLCFKSDVVPTFRSTRFRRVSSPPPSNRRRRRRRNLGGGGCFSAAEGKYEREEIVAEFAAEPVTAFSKSCVGTHEYLAPEIVAGNGHGSGVDWWAFGIFLYEMLYGTTPFKGMTKEQTLHNIAHDDNVAFPLVKEEEEEEEAKDLIKKLLEKDPMKRLGCARGAQDIKRHSFFEEIKWPLIRNYKPPEIRGLVKKTKAHACHVTAVSPRRTRKKKGLWWALSCLLRSNKSNSKIQSNNNYYHYVVGKSYDASRKRV
ncbi:unnamed protein product [Cochlearia groenlandica]